MSDPTGLGEWRPDPTGRHQLRWWDGTAWSDNVADDGQSSIDAMSEEAPRASTKTVMSSASERSVPRVALAAVAIVAVIAVAAVLILFKGGDDDGFGEFSATLDSPGDIEVRTIEVPGKSLVRVQATAERGFVPKLFAITDAGYVAEFDAQADLSDMVEASDLAVVQQQAGRTFEEPSDLFHPATELAQALPGSDLSAVIREGDVIYNDTPGELRFAAPVSGSFRIVVAGSDGGSGPIKIDIERYDIGGESMMEFFDRVERFSDYSS